MLTLERARAHRRWLAGILLAVLPVAPALALWIGWSEWSTRSSQRPVPWGSTPMFEAHQLLALALAGAARPGRDVSGAPRSG